MPDLNTFLGWNETGDMEEWYREQERTPAFMIGHRGVDLVLVRNDVALPAQKVLLVPKASANASEKQNDTALAAMDALIVIGSDSLDIERNDRFSFRPALANRLNYRIAYVEKTLEGMIQARAETIQ